MNTPIILCADDYALTPGISRGIRELAKAGRLSATSAMTVSPYWDGEGRTLLDFEPAVAGRFAIGLHFTLTEYKPLTNMRNLAPAGSLPRLGSLMRLALTRRLHADEIAAELTAQIDRFEAVLGRPPAYLDGHHHVHQLPIVDEIVIEITKKRLGSTPFIRFCDEALARIVRRGVSVPRATVISMLGRRFANRARAEGFRGNRGFRGVRDFRVAENVAELFAAYLKDPRPNMMVMCHPGYDEPVPDIADDIHARRPDELAYLGSDTFGTLLARNQIELRAPDAL